MNKLDNMKFVFSVICVGVAAFAGTQANACTANEMAAITAAQGTAWANYYDAQSAFEAYDLDEHYNQAIADYDQAMQQCAGISFMVDGSYGDCVSKAEGDRDYAIMDVYNTYNLLADDVGWKHEDALGADADYYACAANPT